MKLYNPYYSVGKAHNEGLDYISKIIKADTTIKEIINAVVEFYYSISTEDQCIEKTIEYKALAALVINSYTKNGTSDLLNKQDYLFRQFIDELSNVDKMKPEVIIDFLKDIESRIIMSELRQDKQELLLIGAAIGKSSTRYWMEQYENYDTSPWNVFTEDQLKFKIKLPGWIKADLVGGALGGLIGAGTAPEIVTIVAGAVIGGASASVAAIGG